MPKFERFVARHGEVVAQAILENLERFEGIGTLAALSLEERWQRLMQKDSGEKLAASF